MRLRLHPAALAELEEAVVYLEEERSGFGEIFFAEISRRIAQAARLPRSGAPVMDLSECHDVRQFVAKRFPYVVVTAKINDERLVVAIAHTSRPPRYWHVRLK